MTGYQAKLKKTVFEENIQKHKDTRNDIFQQMGQNLLKVIGSDRLKLINDKLNIRLQEDDYKEQKEEDVKLDDD